MINCNSFNLHFNIFNLCFGCHLLYFAVSFKLNILSAMILVATFPEEKS